MKSLSVPLGLFRLSLISVTKIDWVGFLNDKHTTHKYSTGNAILSLWLDLNLT